MASVLSGQANPFGRWIGVILAGMALGAQAAHATPPARRAHAADAGFASARPAQKDYRDVRDPFAPVPVTTTDALVRLVRTNKRVRTLYARHFGVSEARITEFISNALSLQRLPRSRTFLNYCARPNGAIYAVRTRLAAGELVWATRTGEPMLKWICSNPLTKTLPGTRVAVASRAVPMRRMTSGSLPEDEPLGTTSSLAQEPAEVAGLSGSVRDELAAVSAAVAPQTVAQGLSGTGIQSIAGADRLARTVSLSTAPPVRGPGGGANPFGAISGAPINLPRFAATVATAAPLVNTLAKSSAPTPVTVVPTSFVPTVSATVPEPGSLLLIGAMFPVLCRARRNRHNA